MNRAEFGDRLLNVVEVMSSEKETSENSYASAVLHVMKQGIAAGDIEKHPESNPIIQAVVALYETNRMEGDLPAPRTALQYLRSVNLVEHAWQYYDLQSKPRTARHEQ